jgi:large subunit ribosomal protein L1
MSGGGKRYRAALAQVDRDRHYGPMDAMRLLRDLPTAKFDETVELAMRLGVDPRKADQMIRGTVSLPNGTGRSVRVAAFATGDKAKEAEEAGADVVGGEDLVNQVMSGTIDFDAAVATPDVMALVGRAGRVLGPRGLMPNPKAGTVTFDIGKAVRDIKAGKLEYRVDRQGNLHLIIGKRSFDEARLLENYLAVVDEVMRAKPAAAKGRYIRSVTLTSTMGPGIRIDPARAREVDVAGAPPAFADAASDG